MNWEEYGKWRHKKQRSKGLESREVSSHSNRSKADLEKAKRFAKEIQANREAAQKSKDNETPKG